MKTYFLFFGGDPNPHLDGLRPMGAISSVQVFDSLHCISFGPPHSERVILNALLRSSRVAYLVRASLPIFPEPPRKVQVEIDRLIDRADDNPGFYIGS